MANWIIYLNKDSLGKAEKLIFYSTCKQLLARFYTHFQPVFGGWYGARISVFERAIGIVSFIEINPDFTLLNIIDIKVDVATASVGGFVICKIVEG